ncbi:MAG TPA: M48 family metallopeptidase [Candidatus Avirikenella pullistercoris]|nr:M48 family metallopeptidase [Candidatus Avirikenella pullistercoris]
MPGKNTKRNNIPRNHTLLVGNKELIFSIEYSRRRTLSIQLKQPNGEMTVKAPLGMDIAKIDSFVKGKANWIWKHKERIEFLKNNRIKRIYEEGAQHLYLGETHTLRIIESSEEKVTKNDNSIFVYTENIQKTEKILKRWYDEEAKSIFDTICRPIIADFGKRHNIYPVSVKNKFVKSYWGVCTLKKEIRLNTELLRAPRPCIEYIIVHELCHLIHPNHSKVFYNLLTSEMPDWKKRKKLLEQTISTKD